MRRGFLAVVLCAATIQPTTKPIPGPDEAVAPVVVPLELLGGRPVISVKVNGAGPFRFLIDPSASIGHLDLGLIDALHLRPADTHGSRAGAGSADSRFVDIAIGDVAAPRVEMRPIDMASVVPEFGAATRPRGIVAGSIWSGRLLTIDYPAWHVALAPGALPAPNGQDIFSLDASAPDLALTVTLAGQPIRCEIDLLSTSGLLLPQAYAQTLALVQPPVETRSTRPRSGIVAVREAQLAGNVMLGPAVFVRPVVQFSAQATIPIVGTAWLGDFALIFDLTNRRVRLAHRRPS